MAQLKNWQIIEKWVESLDCDSAEFLSLPRNDDGKILMGKIPLTSIPKKFKDALNENKKKEYSSEVLTISKMDNINDITIIPSGSKSNRSLLQVAQAAKLLRTSKPQCDIEEILQKDWDINLQKAKSIINKARNVNLGHYQESLPTIKSDIYNSYVSLLDKANSANNLRIAKEILDSLVKLTGANEPEKVMTLSEIHIKFDDDNSSVPFNNNIIIDDSNT
jgi:hypothetical protein